MKKLIIALAILFASEALWASTAEDHPNWSPGEKDPSTVASCPGKYVSTNHAGYGPSTGDITYANNKSGNTGAKQ